MSETTKVRKAVVTTAQVAEAFASYASAQKVIGNDILSHEFDKGFRGKGFAEYDGTGAVVRTFETKEDALSHYGLLAEGMWLVIDAAGLNTTDVDESDDSEQAESDAA